MHLPHTRESASAPFFFQLLNDVAQGLWVRHHDLLLCSPEADDAYYYQSMIASKRADGIIFLGQGPGDQWLRDLARIAAIEAAMESEGRRVTAANL